MTKLQSASAFKRFFTGGASKTSVLPIEIGDRFAHNEDVRSVWVVDKVHEQSAHSLPLVTMHREGYPDLCKVLSSAAFDSASEFHRC